MKYIHWLKTILCLNAGIVIALPFFLTLMYTLQPWLGGGGNDSAELLLMYAVSWSLGFKIAWDFVD